MKTEKELRIYADAVLDVLKKNKSGARYNYSERGDKILDPNSVNYYAINQSKTILSVLMYVLEDYSICDLNRV